MKKIIMASGPVIVEDGKVLLNKHGDTTFWKFCGGKVEDDEHTLIEHAEREVLEEMGIKIEILNSLPFFYYTQKKNRRRNSGCHSRALSRKKNWRNCAR